MDLFKQQKVEDFYEIGEELGRYRRACMQDMCISFQLL